MIKKLGVAMLLGATVSAQAAVDNFDGYSGSLFGENGGSASGTISWTSSWTDPGPNSSATIIPAAMGSINGFASSDPFAEYQLTTSTSNIDQHESTRTFTPQTGTSTVYVYGLISVGRTGGVNTTGSFGGFGIYSGGSELFLIGERFELGVWGIQVNGTNLNGTSGDSTVSLGNFTTTLLVAAIDQAANTISLFVNPDFSQTIAANSAAFTLNYGGNNDSFDTIRLRAGNENTGNTWQYDNINVTDVSPFAAVPEPSSLSLLAGPAILGAWFYVRRRRRA